MMSLHVAKTNDISIHAAREGGDRLNQRDVSPLRISIHAAREGGDYLLSLYILLVCIFQSTPPVKAATNILSFVRTFSEFQSTPPVKAAT